MSSVRTANYTILSASFMALSFFATGCATETGAVEDEHVETTASALNAVCTVDTLPNGSGLSAACQGVAVTGLNHEVHGLGAGFWGQSASASFPQFDGAYTPAKFAACGAAFANFNVQKRSGSGAPWVHVTGAKVFATPVLIINPGQPLMMGCDAALFFPFENGTQFTDGSDQALFQIDTGGTLTANMRNRVTRDLWHSPN